MKRSSINMLYKNHSRERNKSILFNLYSNRCQEIEEFTTDKIFDVLITNHITDDLVVNENIFVTSIFAVWVRKYILSIHISSREKNDNYKSVCRK
jgi:hypothetical protein